MKTDVFSLPSLVMAMFFKWSEVGERKYSMRTIQTLNIHVTEIGMPKEAKGYTALTGRGSQRVLYYLRCFRFSVFDMALYVDDIFIVLRLLLGYTEGKRLRCR